MGCCWSKQDSTNLFLVDKPNGHEDKEYAHHGDETLIVIHANTEFPYRFPVTAAITLSCVPLYETIKNTIARMTNRKAQGLNIALLLPPIFVVEVVEQVQPDNNTDDGRH